MSGASWAQLPALLPASGNNGRRLPASSQLQFIAEDAILSVLLDCGVVQWLGR